MSEPKKTVMKSSSGGTREVWLMNGKLHNLNGAAIVVRDAEGNMLREEWWVDGELIDLSYREQDRQREAFLDGKLHAVVTILVSSVLAVVAAILMRLVLEW